MQWHRSFLVCLILLCAHSFAHAEPYRPMSGWDKPQSEKIRDQTNRQVVDGIRSQSSRSWQGRGDGGQSGSSEPPKNYPWCVDKSIAQQACGFIYTISRNPNGLRQPRMRDALDRGLVAGPPNMCMSQSDPLVSRVSAWARYCGVTESSREAVIAALQAKGAPSENEATRIARWRAQEEEFERRYREKWARVEAAQRALVAECDEGSVEACKKWLNDVGYLPSNEVVAAHVSAQICRLGEVRGCETAADSLEKIGDKAAAIALRETACLRGELSECPEAATNRMTMTSNPAVYDPGQGRLLLRHGCRGNHDGSCTTLVAAIAKGYGGCGPAPEDDEVLDAACKRGVKNACSAALVPLDLKDDRPKIPTGAAAEAAIRKWKDETSYNAVSSACEAGDYYACLRFKSLPGWEDSANEALCKHFGENCVGYLSLLQFRSQGTYSDGATADLARHVCTTKRNAPGCIVASRFARDLDELRFAHAGCVLDITNCHQFANASRKYLACPANEKRFEAFGGKLLRKACKKGAIGCDKLPPKWRK